jgi:hypothetical protein
MIDPPSWHELARRLAWLLYRWCWHDTRLRRSLRRRRVDRRRQSWARQRRFGPELMFQARPTPAHIDLEEYAGGLLAGVDPLLAVRLREEAQARRRDLERQALQHALAEMVYEEKRGIVRTQLPYELWRLVDDHDPEAELRRTIARRRRPLGSPVWP